MELTETLLHWVNDGLMVIFFLMVGLEIKREILVGHLSKPGMRHYPPSPHWAEWWSRINLCSVQSRSFRSLSGWGIPMATDIAFAIGVLSLLGSAVPITLKIFLTVGNRG